MCRINAKDSQRSIDGSKAVAQLKEQGEETMKTVKGLLGEAVIAASVASLPANALEMGATDKAIKLAINEWTGQHLSTRVAGAILERAGYSVEYVTAGYGPQFIALGEGDLHATLEIWTSNAPGQFGEAEAAGKVVDIGDQIGRAHV